MATLRYVRVYDRYSSFVDLDERYRTLVLESWANWLASGGQKGPLFSASIAGSGAPVTFSLADITSIVFSTPEYRARGTEWEHALDDEGRELDPPPNPWES